MAATNDDYFVDGINMFKFSSAGQGRAAYGGKQPSFINRYKTLASKVINTLWHLRSAGKIGFEAMREFAHAHEPSGPIHLADWTRKPRYLPVIAASLAHEAAHLNKPRDISANYVPEELVCRTLECLFYQDLVTTGVRIHSQVLGSNNTFRLVYADWRGDLRNVYEYFTKEQLIDFVLNIDTLNPSDSYRAALQGAWVEENLRYWGGPKNRWSPILGYFVRALAASPPPTRNQMVAELMLVACDRGKDPWLKMINAATRPPFTAARIRLALSDPLVRSGDIAKMKARIASWGLAGQPGNGMDCLP